MKLIIDIDEEYYNYAKQQVADGITNPFKIYISNGTPIPDNATNGDVIKAMFGADKVFGFIHYVHLMAKVGNWFNEGVVAEFDKDWWNTPYQKGGKECR